MNKNKPKIIVNENGVMRVDLNTISDETFDEMEKTAKILRKSKNRKE